MQLAAAAQEIADGEPGGSGSTVHAAPFQDSASVPGEAKPTATQLVLLAQDTPDRPASAPPGAGMASILHALPFHDSASVAMLLADGSYCPTAMQSELLTQETQDRLAWSAPTGLSGLCTVQVEPFHVSARVTAFPVPLVPTATQSEADGQATPLKRGASTVAGVFSRVHAVPFHRSAPTPPTAWHWPGHGCGREVGTSRGPAHRRIGRPATPRGADTRRASPAASPRIRSARLMKPQPARETRYRDGSGRAGR
jgi:hypothetical protein